MYHLSSVVQFLSTLEGNIKKISGPVKVSIPKGGVTDGSVLVPTSVVFLNGNDDSAKAYKSAVAGSSASSVYGAYDAVVDPNTFQTDTTANPEQDKQDLPRIMLYLSVPYKFSHAPCHFSEGQTSHLSEVWISLANICAVICRLVRSCAPQVGSTCCSRSGSCNFPLRMIHK